MAVKVVGIALLLIWSLTPEQCNNSSERVVTKLWAGRSGFDSWQGQEFFSLRHHVQTGCGAHLTSYSIGTAVFSPGHEANHSPPSSAEVKKAWSYTSTSSYVFMEW